MALTYLAIVATYIPPIIQGFREGAAETAAVEPAVAEDGTPSAVPAAAAAPSWTAEPADTAESKPTGTLPTVLAVVVMLAIACAAPFLAGFENIIGIVISASGCTKRGS